MKKLSKFFICLSFIFVGIFALVGCGGKSPELPEDQTSITLSAEISTNVDAGLQSVNTKLYNKLTGSQSKPTYLTVAELVESKGLENYYVEVATFSEDVLDITSIVLGDFTFEKNQTTDISIGNGNFIRDKIFYFENNKLYISSVVGSVELYYNSSLRVNYKTSAGNKSKSVDLEFNPMVNQLTLLTPKYNTGTNTITVKGNNSFVFNGNQQNTYVKFGYEEADKEERLVVTKKYSKNASGEKSYCTYGFTKTDETFDDEGNKTFGFYPCYYFDLTESEKVAEYESYNYFYDVYVLGKGIASLNYTFDFFAD